MLLGGQFRARAAARGQSMALDTSGVWGGILSGCTSGQPIFFEPCAVRWCTNVSCAGGHANFLFTQKYWYTCLEKKMPQAEVWKQHFPVKQNCFKQTASSRSSETAVPLKQTAPSRGLQTALLFQNHCPQAEVWKQHFPFKQNCFKQHFGFFF